MQAPERSPFEASRQNTGIGLEVASLGVHESRDGSRREERRTQTLNVVDLNGGSGFLCGPGQSLSQERTLLGKLRVDLGVILEIMQLGKAAAMATGLPLRVRPDRQGRREPPAPSVPGCPQ